jgi:hypothetical protein
MLRSNIVDYKSAEIQGDTPERPRHPRFEPYNILTLVRKMKT